MICADLPYEVTQNPWDAVIPFKELWAAYERIIKDNGAIVLTATQPFTSQLVVSNMKLFRYEWIWFKVRPTGFLNAKKMPLREHESVLVFYKNQPTYNPQGTKRVVKLEKQRVQTSNYGKRTKGEYYQEVGNYPRSIIEFSMQHHERGMHPTQKPLALIEYLIRTYTNEGDIVLDNVAGSMTTAIACINSNRNYICMEYDQKYYDLGLSRINACNTTH
jgi:DNA modification methylase